MITYSSRVELCKPITFKGNSESLNKVLDSISSDIKRNPANILNFVPGSFALGTKEEPKNISSEIKIDPRLLAVYHIRNINEEKNIAIPANMVNPSLSRLKGIISRLDNNQNQLTNKAVNSRGISRGGGDWIKESIMYNMMVRGDTAWDSDHKNGVEFQNSQGVKETGTFIKALELLPHLAKMKVNTIYLNPVSSIGQMGRKGSAGSPYAIKDYYEIDSKLDDTISKTSVDEEFKAFVDAAHKKEMRVMMDFVFRIAAYDNALLIDKPEWCIWRDKDAPMTSSDNSKIPTTKEIEAAIHKAYIEKFNKEPDNKLFQRAINPKSDNYQTNNLTNTWKNAGLEPKDILKALQEITGKVPTQAGPPNDDDGQVWSDVTFLRIGKNDPEIPDLWDYIENVIPHYQNKYGIDSARIDMAHDLNPELLDRILNKARSIDPDFSYFAEDFGGDYDVFWSGNGAKIPENKHFNAACGNIHFVPTYNPDISPVDLKNWESMYIKNWAIDKAKWSDGMIWGTSETHDSTRSAASKGGILHSKASYARYSFYPKVFPAIIGGFELGEETQKKLNDKPSILFDYESLKSWTNPEEANGNQTQYENTKNRVSSTNITDYIQKISSIREKYIDIVTDLHSESYVPIETPFSPIYAYARIPKTKHADGTIKENAILLIQNMDTEQSNNYNFSKDIIKDIILKLANSTGKPIYEIEKTRYKLHDELTGNTYYNSTELDLNVDLKRGQTHLFSLTII